MALTDSGCMLLAPRCRRRSSIFGSAPNRRLFVSKPKIQDTERKTLECDPTSCKKQPVKIPYLSILFASL